MTPLIDNDEFDDWFLSGGPVVDKDETDTFADTALPTGAGVDWDAYPDPVGLDPDDDNPEVA